MDSIYLQTTRVRLRQYQVDDLSKIMDLNSDHEVMQYLTNGVLGTREEAEEGESRTLLYQKKYSGKLGLYLAERIENGEFMGWFHLRPDKLDLENTKTLELGYRLKKKFWGNGYASEVSLALLEKSFGELDAKDVFAQTLAKNLGSRRVMEKIGMHFEKEFIDQNHGRLGPAVMYRISKEQWLRK